MDNLKLDKKEIDLLKYIREYIFKNGKNPSFRYLMQKLNYKSHRSIVIIIDTLIEKQILSKNENGIYQISDNYNSDNYNENTVKIPLVGSAACGLPIFADENIELEIPVSNKIASKPYKYFFLRAKGDSMNKAGIENGDMVLIRQQNTANNGDLVVALIDNEATIKQINYNKDAIILKACSTNPDNKSIILSNDFMIQGIVIKSFKSEDLL